MSITADRTPYVLASSETAAEQAAQRLVREGYSLHHGFDLPAAGWHVAEQRHVCLGLVDDDDTHEAALFAGSRGAGLVVYARTAIRVRRLFEDMQRLGPIEVREEASEPSPLDPDQVRMLELLASGMTQAEVAEALHWSRRTVSRRLASARQTLRARTTAEAVARALETVR